MIMQDAEEHIQELAAEARTEALVMSLAKHLKIVRDRDVPMVTDLLCGWLDSFSAGFPPFFYYQDVRDMASDWVSLATPVELEAYVMSGLRAIDRRTFGTAALKRLMVAIWERLDETDRQKFLAKVDPDGSFRRRGS